jgi:hypothetical protein
MQFHPVSRGINIDDVNNNIEGRDEDNLQFARVPMAIKKANEGQVQLTKED